MISLGIINSPHIPTAMAGFLRFVKPHLPPLNFITLHYTYFIGVCILTSIIFWGSSTPPRSVTYTDSLFFTVSAMTLAGLNTVNLSELNTFQQFILFLLIILGSAILVSSVVVHVRKRAFEKRFRHIIEGGRRRRKAQKDLASATERPFNFSLSRRRSASGIALEPEIDGVVRRGRPIHSAAAEDLEKGSTNNPGDHSPVDRHEHQRKPGFEENSSKEEESRTASQSVGPSSIEHAHGIGLGSDNTRTSVVSPQIRFTLAQSPARNKHRRVLSMQGIGAVPGNQNHPSKIGPPLYPIPTTALSEEKGDHPAQGTHKYFSSGGMIGRNSRFHNLTLEEREKLGGVEYRAIVLLEIIVPLYFVLFQLFGCLGLGAWVAVHRSSTTRENGLNPWWVGAFNAVSAFNNSGMSLLDANMVVFQDSIYMLITMGMLILAGNTCYPILLRLIIWVLHAVLPNNGRYSDQKVALRFLLDHPRRCYTTLFPSSHTWYLLFTLTVLNCTDWIAFEILNLGNPIIKSLPTNIRVIDGLFQALAVRSGGFYVVNISQLRIGLLVLYVIMMYISVYPVSITLRNSNIYEERSLGIYTDDSHTSEPQSPDEEQNKVFASGALKTSLTPLAGLRKRVSRPLTPFSLSFPQTKPSHLGSRTYFLRQQLRGQLAHDLWYLILAVLLIVITETSSFEVDPVSYSVFNVIFEVISAYGCVGISVGLPNAAYSFSGGWHVFSKLVLCAVMLRGRHRGLPVAIDGAVLLPAEALGRAEEEDARVVGSARPGGEWGRRSDEVKRSSGEGVGLGI